MSAKLQNRDSAKTIHSKNSVDTASFSGANFSSKSSGSGNVLSTIGILVSAIGAALAFLSAELSAPLIMLVASILGVTGAAAKIKGSSISRAQDVVSSSHANVPKKLEK